MKYLTYTALDGETNTFDTKEEAMKEAREYIQDYMTGDDFSSDDGIVVYQAIAMSKATEIDTKDKALAEGREWEHAKHIEVLVDVKLTDWEDEEGAGE